MKHRPSRTLIILNGKNDCFAEVYISPSRCNGYVPTTKTSYRFITKSSRKRLELIFQSRDAIQHLIHIGKSMTVATVAFSETFNGGQCYAYDHNRMVYAERTIENVSVLSL